MSSSPIQTSCSVERNDGATPRDAARFDTLRQGGIAWRMDRDLAQPLLAAGGLDVEQRLRDGSATVVKSGDHRTVYRLQLPCGRFYLKHYRVADWKTQLQNCLRRSPAEREWRAIDAVANAGIATIEPVAVGVRPFGPFAGDSFLLARAIEPAESLQDYVRRLADPASEDIANPRVQISPSRRQVLAGRLGTLIAALHSHGLVHDDLHAGNVLIRDEPAEEVRLWLIDLHAVRQRPWLSLRRVARNLAMFAHFFARYGTPADRLRFFEAYWSGVKGCPSRPVSLIGNDPPSRRHILHTIQSACEEWSLRAYDKADRKWLRGHRKLYIVDTPAAHCRAVAELDEDFVGMIARHPEVLLESRERDSQLARFWLWTLDSRLSTPERPSIRIHTGSSGKPVSLDWLGGRRKWSLARVGWEISHALLRRGIPTPRPLLLAEERGGPQPRTFLITESPRDAERETASTSSGGRSAIRQAAKILHRLHEHGFVHGRLSESAFLVASGSHAGVRVLLKQIDAVRSVSEVSVQRAAEQLAELNASVGFDRFTSSDRLRFLLAYLGPKRRDEWKALWRETHRIPTRQTQQIGIPRRRFLRAALALAGLALGCQTPKQTVLARPARHSIRSGPLVVYSNFKLPKHHPLIEDLILLRKQVAVDLDLPVQKEEVAIYIFSTEKEFRDYLNRAYPGLPNRRAFFMGSRDELAVYTYWGERIQEDLRHEYTHGLLHASLRAVPLWLDEGLAEYFEVAGPRPGTVNTEYAGRLAASVVSGWRPNMAALEKLEEFSRMQHIHYQEAWAWVHYMLHDSTGAKPILLAYLHDLRTQTSPMPLSERLKRQLPNAEERFLAHASTLQTPQLLRPGRVVPTAGTASRQPSPGK